MKNEKGFSLLVLVITIIVLIILAAITLKPLSSVVDDSTDAKFKAEATSDDNKIKEIITYEFAGTKDLIDDFIGFMRVELNDDLQIEYDGKTYGDGFYLYLSEKDIDKVEEKTGLKALLPYKELTKSYVANHETGEYVRLQNEWEFK